MEENKDNINNEELESIDEVKDIDTLNTSDIDNSKETIEDSLNNEEENNTPVLEEKTDDVEISSIEPIENDTSDSFGDDSFSKTESQEELITVRPVKFQEFEQALPNRSIKKNLDIMQDISMHVSVELGRTKSSIREVMEMEEGTIVELDKIAGEQVEIFVNEKLVAKGEVIVIEDKFGVRVTSTSLPKEIV